MLWKESNFYRISEELWLWNTHIYNLLTGKECYVCDSCGKVFRFPNPLKAHIQYRCTQDAMSQQQRKLFRPFLDSTVTETSQKSATKSGNMEMDLRTPISAFQSPKRRHPQFRDSETQALNFHRFPPLPFFSMPLAPMLAFQSPDLMYSKFLTPCLLPSSRASTLESSLQEWQKEFSARQTLTSYSTDHARYKLPLPSDVEGEPLDLLPKSFFSDKSQKGHLCLYCGKLYSRKYGLKIHLRTHTGYKPLKCKVCMRPFGDPSNLNKHVRLHAEGQTPYRCTHCGKILVRRRDLERHVKSRHPKEAMKTEQEEEILVI